MPKRALLILLAVILTAALSAKKAQPVLEWKDGILWASPDPCNDFSGFNKESFLIIGDDILYHVSRRTPLGRKPNVTEHSPVKYTMADGEFYLQDEDGRVFKLSVVKKELIPKAEERLKNGQPPCLP